MRIILASASPRRKELLASLGLDFDIIVSDCNEDCMEDNPAELVKTLSYQKAESVRRRIASSDLLMDSDNDTLIIGSDTVVALNGVIFGKPHSREEAKRMITSLSGKTHSVFSGVTVLYQGKAVTDFSETLVTFRKVDSNELDRYLDSDEPYDKAGAYGIQGKAGAWVSKIDGSYSGVVGLPVSLLCSIVYDHFGISLI